MLVQQLQDPFWSQTAARQSFKASYLDKLEQMRLIVYSYNPEEAMRNMRQPRLLPNRQREQGMTLDEWNKSFEKNPDENVYIPELLVGFEGLQIRRNQQLERVSSYKKASTYARKRIAELREGERENEELLRSASEQHQVILHQLLQLWQELDSLDLGENREFAMIRQRIGQTVQKLKAKIGQLDNEADNVLNEVYNPQIQQAFTPREAEESLSPDFLNALTQVMKLHQNGLKRMEEDVKRMEGYISVIKSSSSQ
uniref:Nucleoporin Nup54 alpha-helical domain-containing protein n=1 Tax=Palpitomonas bilix TaxID=652834 RepID=A0A7S3GL62_9EUKA|mmetsp:Transcript_8115/g.21478  ORF Transcript_8115/g.21478 Transcript_8115/m.21478 type:complete len:255 (+) Transcript_8115:582-1346(+)